MRDFGKNLIEIKDTSYIERLSACMDIVNSLIK